MEKGVPIRVSRKVRKALQILGKKGETYTDVLKRMIEAYANDTLALGPKGYRELVTWVKEVE